MVFFRVLKPRLLGFTHFYLVDLNLILDTNVPASGLMLILSQQINAEHEVEKS